MKKCRLSALTLMNVNRISLMYRYCFKRIFENAEKQWNSVSELGRHPPKYLCAIYFFYFSSLVPKSNSFALFSYCFFEYYSFLFRFIEFHLVFNFFVDACTVGISCYELNVICGIVTVAISHSKTITKKRRRQRST